MDVQAGSGSGGRSGPWARFKARYHRLPPPVQMIGLQLWLPVAFVVLFSLCYIGAFHAPNPQGVRVDVVGQSTSARQLALSTTASSQGTLRVSTTPVVDTGSVRRGDVGADFEPGSPGHPATLVVASANQFQISSLAEASFAPIAAAEHAQLRIDDIAPLPARDSYGNSIFYITLVMTIAGYMIGLFVSMMGGPLPRRHRVGIIVAVGLALSLITTTLVGPVIGAVSGHFLGVFAVGWATIVAAGLAVNGLGYFLGRFVAGAALTVFVFANVPSSGGAYPVQFVPEPFSWLNHIVFGGGVLPLLQHAVYNVGPGTSRGVLTLACYAAIGLVLAYFGQPYAQWRTRRRIALRLPFGGMMATAQEQLAARLPAAATPSPDRGRAGARARVRSD